MSNERLPFLIKFMEKQIEELEAERIPGLAARGDVEMSAHREILDVLTSLSAGVPPPAAETPNKLLWLATESAESFHDYYISYGFPHPCTEKLLDAAAHFGDFGVCLHPDCVLVRAVPPPADETRKWRCGDCGVTNDWESLECARCGMIQPPDRERWEVAASALPSAPAKDTP